MGSCLHDQPWRQVAAADTRNDLCSSIVVRSEHRLSLRKHVCELYPRHARSPGGAVCAQARIITAIWLLSNRGARVLGSHSIDQLGMLREALRWAGASYDQEFLRRRLAECRHVLGREADPNA